HFQPRAEVLSHLVERSYLDVSGVNLLHVFGSLARALFETRRRHRARSALRESGLVTRGKRGPGRLVFRNLSLKDREGLEKGLHDRWVKLCSGVVVEKRARLISGHSLSVLPVFSDGVERIHDGQDARGNRNLFAGFSVGIAAAVPALVMMADDRDNRIRE